MTKDQYFQFHARCLERMTVITKAKNADYTGSSTDNPFANFTRVEGLGICSTEVGFLTRMTDKLCRLASFASKGELQVKDESVEDTLLDLANYCILLAGYLESKKVDKVTTGYAYEFSVGTPQGTKVVASGISTAQKAAEGRAP
jgi:hypothetical protein